jgi:signal transduction histidine kinase
VVDDILIVSAMDGAQVCARIIGDRLGVPVEVAATRRDALAALRRQRFAVLVVEESLVEGDTLWADQLWEQAGIAMPLQINFAIAGCARLVREVKAAMQRRSVERATAQKAALTELAKELKSTVTGILLESELALREPGLPAELNPRLRHLVDLAGALRDRLQGDAEWPRPV